MCGRYQINDDDDEIRRIVMSAKTNAALSPWHSGEISPETSVPIVTRLSLDGPEESVMTRWGFPKWNGGGSIINARRETASEKPFFARAFSVSRCIVPASGFYEWGNPETAMSEELPNLFSEIKPPKKPSRKKKFYFTLPGESVMYMAGLCWNFGDIPCCVILTGDANESMSDVHPRMPLVLTRSELDMWLSDTDAAGELLAGEIPLLDRRPA